MRFRVKSDGAAWSLMVEDGEGAVLATAPAGTLMEAKRLQRVAVIDGLDALSKQAPPKKKGK